MIKTNYEHVKEWRKHNKDKVNAQARRYRAKHPDKVAAIKKKYRQINLEVVREKDARAKRNWRHENPEAYRLWQERLKVERVRRQEKQAGRPRSEICDLCKRSETTVYDHCHKTGIFRGWLCHRCNRVLGSVYDDIDLLQSMIIYLQENQSHGKTNKQTTKSNP